MSNKFSINGFLIQNLNKISTLFNILNPGIRDMIFNKYKLNYIMGYQPWPLWGNKKYREINNLLDSTWQTSIEPPYELELINSIEVLNEYIEYCHKEKMHIRVLLICSDRNELTIAEKYLRGLQFRFMGYDYIESNCEYSYTLANLYNDEFINRDIHLNNINKYALFKNVKSLENYIDDLYKIYNTGDFLEMFDMCCVKIYQVIL